MEKAKGNPRVEVIRARLPAAPARAARSQVERLVGPVQQGGAVQFNVTAGGQVLRVAALHPQDGFQRPGHASLDRRGKAAPPGRDAREAGRIEADVGESPDDHRRDLGGRGLARQVKLQAILDPPGEKRRTGAAGHGRVDAAVAGRVRQRLEQAAGLPGLGEEVEVRVLRDANAWLVGVTESIVLATRIFISELTCSENYLKMSKF
jgi:hypothetical protein